MPTPHTDLVALLDHAHRGPAWHGPSLKATLRGITFAEAVWRPAEGRNTVWELVVHAAYGKYLVAHRIDPDVEPFPRRLRRSWWPEPAGQGPKEWKDDLRLLDACHETLRSTVGHASASALRKKSSTASRFELEREVVGVALHDTYHGGQIRLIRKLFETGG
jgi:hypothetical protein